MQEPNRAIIILGGGLARNSNGAYAGLHPWVAERINHALELTSGDEYLITTSRATTHLPPPLDGSGRPIDEGTALAEYLLREGIEPERILAENASFDTIGNAYFTRMQHCEPAQLHELTVITSAFHMPRSEAIFRWVYGLEPSPGYTLSFSSSPNTGLSLKDLAAREAKERRSLEHVLDLREQISTLKQLHRWISTEHAAYAPALTPLIETDPTILNSY